MPSQKINSLQAVVSNAAFKANFKSNMEVIHNLKEGRSLQYVIQNNLIDSKKRILFATIPADGHFNPLTPLAAYLKEQGNDVRWYTSTTYAEKLAKLNIRHYPLKKAFDINGRNVDETFPERKKIKGLVKKLNFDMINGYVLRSTEYYEDIKDIHSIFPFDIVVCDSAFIALPLIKRLLKVPVIAIGVFPLVETSKDLAPAGLGITPSKTFAGKIKQDLLRFVVDKILFGKPTKMMRALLKPHGIKMNGSNIFDLIVRESTLLLQIGTPGFEYKRSDLGNNIRFIGALLPHVSNNKAWHHPKLLQYRKILLVTQGTVEKDISKLIIPVLTAFRNSEYLVIVTTGGSHTKELREAFNYDNIIIEDFIPFSEIMPLADVYITNGGYGGVMLSITNKLPMVVAGIHEGKGEINARVGYFNVGVNLHTEKPGPEQLKAAVEKVMLEKTYRHNIEVLSKELEKYNSTELCASYIYDALNKQCKTIFLSS